MTTISRKKPITHRGLFDNAVHQRLIDFVEHEARALNPFSDLDRPEDFKKFNRLSLHNPALLVQVHQQLTEFAASIFGCEVKPSYSFLSMYQAGGQCYLHRDREQCRFTIDYLISQEQPEPWPITISDELEDHEMRSLPKRDVDSVAEMTPILTANEWTTCFLLPNDAVSYSGTHAWHYRPTRSIGRVSLAFFHFVEKEWNGTLN